MGKRELRYYNCRMVTTAKISGMTCAHCVRAVFTSLAGVRGISTADVSLGQAVIDHDGTVSNEAISEAISIAGYTAVAVGDSRRTLPVV